MCARGGGVSKSCYLSFSLCVWRANIVVRNQLQLFILHIETHRPTIKCATEKAVHRVQAERRTPGTQFDSLFHITILTRWRYHYKLHGINIHLPIYSMSCGSNTIHVLLLHPLHTDCVCVENGRNRKIVSICGCTFSNRVELNLVELFRISFIWLSLYDNWPFTNTHSLSSLTANAKNTKQRSLHMRYNPMQQRVPYVTCSIRTVAFISVAG